jgi:hypothetical protein
MENDENSNAVSNVSKDGPKTPVFSRLYESRHKADEERMTTREELFLAEMEECTFSPAIPLKKHEKDKISNRTPVWERLHDDKMSMQMLRDEIKATDELIGCTFQPKTPEVKDKVLKKKLENAGFSDANILNRLTKVDTKKSEKLEAEKAKLELKECSFKPALNHKHRKPASKILDKSGKSKSRSGSIYERLHEDAKMQVSSSERRAKQHTRGRAASEAGSERRGQRAKRAASEAGGERSGRRAKRAASEAKQAASEAGGKRSGQQAKRAASTKDVTRKI